MKTSYIAIGAGFVALMVVIAGLAVVIAKQRDSTPTATPPVTAKIDLEGPALERNADNTTRKNDAAKLLASVSDFQSNNNGKLPSTWKNGNLVGASGSTPVPVELDYYKTVTVRQGANGVLGEAELGLTLAAKCGSNGVTVASTARAAAAQFHDSSGPQCIEL